MDGNRIKPNNLGELCRLCLTDDDTILPIFGEDESSTHSQTPLSFRIMACVSVEVTLEDNLPTVICEKCLNYVNSWHEFKQICDISQATLKEWLISGRESGTLGEKDICIKIEPLDNEEEEEEEEVMEVMDQDDEPYMVDYIKQEIDDYEEEEEEEEEEEREDCASVESVHEDELIYHSNPSISKTCINDDDDVEIIPIPQLGDVSHLRITDIKTESVETIDDEVTVTPSPCEGRLLRSVLQGKRVVSSYTKSTDFDETSQGMTTIKPYHCQSCSKSFAYNYLLKRHEKTHVNDKNICGFCRKIFLSHSDLAQHVQLWNENGTISRPYACDHCSEKFACRTQYLMHADGSDGSNCIANNDHIVTEDGSYKCEECFEDFPSVMLLRLHMRKEHLHFSCHKCNKVFSNGVSLSNHLRSHSSSVMRHYCEKCPSSFTTADLLKKHEKIHMKEAAAMAVIPPEVVSNSSEYNIYANSSELAPEPEVTLYEPSIKQEPPDSPEAVQMPSKPVRNANSSQSQPHICEICSEEFPTLASLRFHLKGVHMHYQCHRCPKVYGSGVALSNHLRSHSVSNPGKKHKCMVCMKGFATVDLKMRHEKTHAEPPKSTSVEEGVLQNELENIPEPAFESTEEDTKEENLAKRTCSICEAVLASPSALERHMSTHNREKAYSCKICYSSMSYASSLQKHYRVMHGRVIELKSIQRDPDPNQKDSEATASNEKGGDVSALFSVPQEETLEQVESFTRSGRRIVSYNRTFQVSPPVQRTHLPTPFECKVCHRRYAYRSFLLKHSKVHEKQNEKPSAGVACPICYKVFPSAKTLNNHKGVHTRFKHYGCTVCGKSFNGMNAWHKHQRMHQKGFIYSCKLCGKKFLSKSELHSHKKMHIKLKIYSCSVCKNSYHSSSALGKHKRRHNHYSASAEETDISDVEVLGTFKTPISTKPPITKPPVMKPPVVKPAVPKSTILRNPIVPRQMVSKSHFPSGKRRHFCSSCNKMFSNIKALRRHKLMHDRMVKPLGDVISAEQSVPETNDNTCLTCNRVFPDHTSLVRHKGWHTRRFNFPVITTSPPSSEPKPLNPCFVKPEPSPVENNQCALCPRTFSTNASLESHMRSHSESGKSSASSSEKKVKGTVEEDPVLNSPRRLACKICKKPFESKKALITHIGWHSRASHSLKPLLSTVKANAISTAMTVGDKFSCNVCHKFFSSAMMLNKHKRLHTRKLLSSIKVKPASPSGEPTSETEGDYSCPVCLKTFKVVKYLNLHMRLHTGEKKFKCNLCNQAYHRSGSLWKHKRTHHAFKVFCCHICQKRFGIKNQLMKHMETHGTFNMAHTPAPKTYTVYACSYCEKTFAKIEKLRQHERAHRA